MHSLPTSHFRPLTSHFSRPTSGTGVQFAAMSSGLPDYWPLMVAYHQAREPLYRGIIRDLGLAPDVRLLDAGSGDGFYSQMLSSLLGPAAQIVALDCDRGLLKLAWHWAPNVHRCLGDLEHPALAPASFDAIWLCRSLYSALNPRARLAALVPLLKPDGKIIVVENDTAHYPMLPWRAEFEHRLRDARLCYERSRCPDQSTGERYKAASHMARWLHELGLVHLAVHTYVSEDLAPLDPKVEAYWKVFLAWDANILRPYLSAADAAEYCAAFDPSSPAYLFSKPGCYCLELTTVAVAVWPAPNRSRLEPYVP